MGLITLRPQATAVTAPVDGSGTLIGTLMSGFTPLVDVGVALQVAGDGQLVSLPYFGGFFQLWVAFQDDGSIPANTVITSVQFVIRHRTGLGSSANLNEVFYPIPAVWYGASFGSHGVGALIPLVLPSTDPVTIPRWTVSKSAAMTVNPATAAPWTRADLFHIAATSNGLWRWLAANNGPAPYQLDAISLLVQCTTPVSNVKLRTNPVLSIHNQPAGQTTATLRAATAPRGGQRVSLGVRDPLLDGTIQSWTQVFEGSTLEGTPVAGSANWSWDCTAVGAAWLLNRRRPFGIWTNVSCTQVVQDLVAQFAPSFTTDHVQTGLAHVTVAFDGSLPFDQCLTQLATLIGSGIWEIDLQRDLHFFRVPPPPLPAYLPILPVPAALTVSESAVAFTQAFLPAGYYGYFLRVQYADRSWSDYSLLSNIVALSGQKQIDFTIPIVGPNTAGSPVVQRVIVELRCNNIWTNGGTLRTWVRGGLAAIPDNTTTTYRHDFPGEFGPQGGVVIYPAVGAFQMAPFRPLPGPATAPTVTETGVLYATAGSSPFPSVETVGSVAGPFGSGDVAGNLFSAWPVGGVPGVQIGGNDYTFVGYFDTAFGPGDYAFCVTCVYANGAESLPGPPTSPITLTGTHRLQFDNIPIGLPVEVPVAYRKIYLCSYEPRPAHGTPTWQAPQLFLIVPDNTTTSLHDQAWTNDPSYGNNPPATLAGPREGGVSHIHELGALHSPFFVSGPVYGDGPSLETDPPPDPITFQTRLDHATPPTAAVDHSQIRNRVFLKGPGSTVSAAANIGDRILTVADITPFATGGIPTPGTLLVAAAAALPVPIAACSAANPTVVTTVTPHGLVSLQQVTIAGNLPITGAWTVTVLTPSTFTIPVIVPIGASGGTVTAQAIGSYLLPYAGVLDPTLPYLTLVTPLTVLIPVGTAVNVWVQRDDVPAQLALSLVEDDGAGDGIREYRIPDGTYATTADCQARCDAELVLFARPIVTVTYSTRDRKTRVGAVVHVDFVPGIVDPLIGDAAICDTADTSNPAAIVADLVIQDVVIDEIAVDLAQTLDPRMTVTASSVRYTFQDFLRQLAG